MPQEMSTPNRRLFTPASFLLQRFASASAAAKYFGITRAAVSKWQRPKKHQGTEGRIPERYWRKILDSGYMTIEQLTADRFEVGGELLPCKTCGWAAGLADYGLEYPDEPIKYQVLCTNGMKHGSKLCSTAEEAISDWNKRGK